MGRPVRGREPRHVEADCFDGNQSPGADNLLARSLGLREAEARQMKISRIVANLRIRSLLIEIESRQSLRISK
jgi:hypothetical protein